MENKFLINGLLILALLLTAVDNTEGQASKLLTPTSLKGKIIHVAKTGNDANNGSGATPLLTISKAETLTQPGDRILIGGGIYREMIVLHRGGTADNARITYAAAPGEKVIIKGSERIKSWVKRNDHTWRTEIADGFFKGSNPFTILVNKDSSYMHLGEVYFENRSLREQRDISDVANIESSWYAYQENGKTVITANFGEADPNVKIVEINVRPSAFTTAMSGVSYIVLEGLKIAQIASPMADVNGEQTGAIALNGGTRWVIQNCTISDCKSVGISIGQRGHTYPGASPAKPEYSDLSQENSTVGHAIIKHNHIFNCGQAGIFGLLHGSFSEIADNLIEDINADNKYPSDECAGIHLAFAIDALISHNLIRRTGGYGLFLGPLLQGTRVTKNVISDTRLSCLYLYNSHGPNLFDNNILSGPGKTTNEGVKMVSSEANVFAQNLFNDCSFSNTKVPGRSFATSNFLAHSLIIKQTIPALPMDDRWFDNLFVKGGLDGVSCDADCLSDNNVFLEGAVASSWGDKHSKTIGGNAQFRLTNTLKGTSLTFNSHLLSPIPGAVLSPEFIGFFSLSKQYLESADGKPITINKDFKGTATMGPPKLAGPFYQYPVSNKKQQLFLY